jgi:membrane protease YdiL (CAAX protease family)
MPARRTRRSSPPRHGLGGYWELTQQPLQALVFLLPMIAAYEFLLPFVNKDEVHQFLVDITARRFLYEFFAWFGVTGYYLPGLIVCAVLLSWHVVRKDPWKLEWRAYGLMLLESCVLALPLFVLLLVVARQVALQGGVEPRGWFSGIVFAAGAGIYEEFVFRLVGIALVHLMVVDLLGLPDKTGATAAVVISSVLFALYHFPGLDHFTLGRFLQYALGGAYLAGVYLLRGFGIAASTHALYNAVVLMTRV